MCILGLAAVYASFCPGTERGENNLWEELCIELNILLYLGIRGKLAVQEAEISVESRGSVMCDRDS